MKKRILVSCVLLALVMTLSCVLAIGASAAETVTMTEVAAGASPAGKVVTIANEAELRALKSYVAEGKTTEGITFRLTASIALADPVKKPGESNLVAGNNASNSPDIGTADKPFKGIFDGNGFAISNLKISKWSASPEFIDATDLARGLFAYTDGATIQGLTVVAGGVRNAKTNIGAVVGYAKNTTIVNCKAEGTLTAAAAAPACRLQCNVGGIVGTLDGGKVVNSTSLVSLTGKENVGGVAGLAKNGALISGCVASGDVGFSNQANAAGNNFGGIVGKLESSSVVNSVSLAKIYAAKAAEDTAVAGGIAGAMDALSAMKNVVMQGAITATADGGVTYGYLAGIAAGDIVNAYVAGNDKFIGNGAADVAAVTFDGSLKLASAVTVAGKETDNLTAALNLWVVEENKNGASYSYWKAQSGKYTAFVAEAHTHIRSSAPACQVAACSVCEIPMDATTAHKRPADAIACAEDVKCEICNTFVTAPTAEHNIPENTPACKEDVVCADCGKAIPPTKSHRVLTQADCLNGANCADCRKETTPAQGHEWDGGQTCAKAEKCQVCGTENPEKPATGIHSPDREAPTCTDPVRCTVCTIVMKGEDGKLLNALGHQDPGTEANCGYAKKCVRCKKVLEDAKGDHQIDWDNAEVQREPTAEKPGLSIGTCSVCGKTQEKYISYVDPNAPVTPPPASGDTGNTGDTGDTGNTGDAGSTGEQEPTKEGLPVGALIGIIAGAVVVVGGGVAAVVIVISKKKKATGEEATEEEKEEE